MNLGQELAFAVVNSGGNLSIVSFTCTATTVTIEYNCIQVNINDKMTIIGLEVRAINEASSGIITRTGGTGIIDGLPIGEALSQNLSSTDLTATPNYYATVNYSSGFLFGLTPIHGNVGWFLQMMEQRKLIFNPIKDFTVRVTVLSTMKIFM